MRPEFAAKARTCPGGIDQHRVIVVPIADGKVDAWIDPGVSGTAGSAPEINWAHGSGHTMQRTSSDPRLRMIVTTRSVLDRASTAA